MKPDRAANSAVGRRMPSCTVASWGISCMKLEDKDTYKTSVKNEGSVPNPTDKKGVSLYRICTYAKRFDIKSNKHRAPSILTPYASHESYPRPSLSFGLTIKNTYTNTRPHIIQGSSDYLSPTPGSPDASFWSVVTDYVKNSLVTVKNQAEL